MSSAGSKREHVSFTAENVGGIERTTVEFEPGVTILKGRNATHRTSLLQAIMAGLGSQRVSLKGDAEEGKVRLQIGKDVYTRILQRQGNGVAFDGDPYLEDPELADLFAFLLESNEARRTVARGGDLREIIMEPIDAESIQAEIRRLEEKKREVEETISDLESLRSDLPELEEQRNRVESEIEDVREQLSAKRAQLDGESADTSGIEDEQSGLDAKMAQLQEVRSSLERASFQMDSQRDSLETLQAELADLEEKREGLSEEGVTDISSIQDDIDRLRERKQTLETELTKLQSVIQFNEEMMDGTSRDIAAALQNEDSDAESVTDQLLDRSESVVCWTCGTAVEQTRIEETLERLRELRESKYGEQSDVESRLTTLKERKSEIESRQRERDRLDEKIEDVRQEIADREGKIAHLEDRREELQAEVEELQAEVEALEEPDQSEVLETHRKISELEIELDRLEDERDRIQSNIEKVEARTAEIETLNDRKERLQSELTDLRTRIDRIEEEAIEEFNEHIDSVLDILDYTNIERIWVEQTEREVREGRRTVSETAFDLHVVRSTDEGVTYEDDFQHLSESEREVTSLVFALAGYLAHDVHEEVPFVLLDSLEAIDSDRIAKLVEYLQEYAEYLVVALLPEDADALDDSYRRVTEI